MVDIITHSTKKVPEWHEQYGRMMRWFKKFERISKAGKIVDTVDALDVIYAFFQNCYHLKDWVAKDASLPTSIRLGVDRAISENNSMIICDCLANGTKHKELSMTRRRKAINSIVFRPKIELTIVADHPEKSKGYYAWNLVINDNEMEIKGIDLARNCIIFWSTYLKSELP
jgi:hypothetical protein